VDVNLLSVIVAPRKATARIASRPSWVTSFLLLAAVSVALYVAAHPFALETTLAHLPKSATAEEKNVIAQTLRNELVVNALFLPIRLLVGWFAFAVALFGMTRTLVPPQPVHLVNVLSLEVHTECVNVLAYAATCLLMYTGVGETSGAVLAPLSVAMFADTNDPVLRTLLNAINPFTVWYLTVLTAGIRTQSRLSRTNATLVVILTWLSSMLFTLGSVSFIRSQLHLNV